MATVQVTGKRAYYHDGGVAWREEVPFVVFLHGAGMDHTLWQQQSRALAHHGFNVAAVDLPGHGRSEDVEDPSAIASIADYAAWLAAFLSAAGIARAALVGHSMGAPIALTLAAHEPDRVAALVLVGAGLQMKVSQDLLRDTGENMPRAVGFITAYAHGRPSHLGGAPTPGNWLLGSASALVGASSSEVLHRDFQVCAIWDGAPLAPRVNCPTLVVAGGGDRMTPPSAGKALAEAVPGARYELFSRAGHMLPTEEPRKLLKLLREFLAVLR